MKKLFKIIAITTIALTSCNKQQEEDSIIQPKKTDGIYNQKCGVESNMISKVTFPFNMDETVAQSIIDINVQGIATGENYIRITKDDAAQVFIMELMKYTTTYPAHEPSADKTIYEGTDAEIMSIMYYAAWLNLECTPVEWFVWNGVYYVEDCC